METRTEKQTSAPQEKSRQRLVRRESMDRIKPSFSHDPDRPVNIHSEETSACSQEHTTSQRQQQLKT
ncbi:hypothetical protein QQF64_018209 [Cirrhinus molitorella]|uniref:Uncharacterized protein n=1 Tax=Cirrhinus molitorella TaxID=172907 RepID=A0ABR3LN69_9TELE